MATAEQKVAAVRWLMPFVRLSASAVERDEFLKRIAGRLDVDLAALRVDLAGGERFAVRPPTPRAPLAADAFLAWAWEHGPRAKGTAPITVDDLHFDLGAEDVTREELRRQYVHLAARVRRNQRIGLDPWEGIAP